MLKEIIRSFFYLLLLNNFMFKFFMGVELPLMMENSPKKIFRFSSYVTLVFVLTVPIIFYIDKLVLLLFKLDDLNLIINSSIIILLVYLVGLFFKEFQVIKRFVLLNVIFLNIFLYGDNLTILEGLIFALLNGIFLFISFILLSDLYERIETKAEKLNPEFVYYLSVSIIAMIMFGFTGLKI